MEKSKLRKPAVAGQFYPLSNESLKEQIEILVDKELKKIDIIACMLPHAGYLYSGKVAAQTASQIKIRDTVILLGPNHTGYGVPFSIMTEGVWQTPMGEVAIDSALAKQILSHSSYLKEDSLAHLHEHSLEVELPFLQYFKTDFKIVPIILSTDQASILKEIGKEIAQTINASGIKDSIMLVASSDLTHYESQAQAQKKDKQAIQAILDLNEDTLMEKIQQLNISMCGYAPVITVIVAAKLLGAHSSRLIKYQTSGDITQDFESVVGYAGIIIY
ncbi:MAG: AmmeMemoRadiSam system protein B [Omnitrophica WOR_2 bacterium RIFCSPLOWO2_01_FULL_41_12]|nr:MAG: AmmeMemoRadiSam system protein B [Omnitrophica WOR_2 bacterium RIFCSPLOWO2_01_FULL_41_12]